MLYWEVDIRVPKGTNESVFECLDSALQGIEVVLVWLNELEANVLWLKVSIVMTFVVWLSITLTFGLLPLLTRYLKF